MSLLLRCLQQPDCETIPSDTAVAIVASLLKKINLLPLNCNQDQRECATKGLEVIRAFLEIPSATKTSHVTYYDLLREVSIRSPLHKAVENGLSVLTSN